MCSDRGDTPQRVPGFPIRISTDRRSLGSSPWLFAARHVLHRCSAPRHPPLALCSLEEQRCSCSLCNSQRAVSAKPPALEEPACFSQRTQRTEETTARRTLGDREERTYDRSTTSSTGTSAPTGSRTGVGTSPWTP